MREWFDACAALTSEVAGGQLIYQQVTSLQRVGQGIASRYALGDDDDAKGCGCYVTSVPVMDKVEAMLHAICPVSLFYPILRLL
jgi:hypothetical protein